MSVDSYCFCSCYVFRQQFNRLFLLRKTWLWNVPPFCIALPKTATLTPGLLGCPPYVNFKPGLLQMAEMVFSQAMFTLFWIAFAAARKSYQIRLLFTNKNSDFEVISVTEWISKVESQISYRSSCYTGWIFVSVRKVFRYSMNTVV